MSLYEARSPNLKMINILGKGSSLAVKLNYFFGWEIANYREIANYKYFTNINSYINNVRWTQMVTKSKKKKGDKFLFWFIMVLITIGAIALVTLALRALGVI